ncbi:extracellular solute-binding protein [Streptosporangium sp. NPDC048047]|uniref:ABC transporter substrate-binding protein n=1 Tax=Streptosporangium sp. NPDC048047 TaxID=3155748 RepID=UPI00342A7534
MFRRRTRLLALALPVAVLLSACGGEGGEGGGSDGSDRSLTVWTVEDVADRVEAQKRILADFTKATGVPAKLVPVAEDQLTSVLSSAAAADDLPDVIGALPLTAVNRLLTDDLLDTETAAAVVGDLGEDTFTEQALKLTRGKGAQLAVPSDGWAQLLFYRKDLFDKAGLAAPDTYDAISKAARTLGRDGTTGIVAGTAPGDSFTQQSFESLALANGCDLVGANGDVALDSPGCAEAFGFYSGLLRDHSVRGNQDADTTRASYFSGRAAMTIWSSFLLDELAGLRDDALPSCPECKDDKTFLAKNTGVVSALRGPKGTAPVTFGEIVSWAVVKGAPSAEARKFVGYMMGDGYEKWLAVSPEGKVPVRQGTKDDPRRYLTAWKDMKAGVDRKEPLSRFYGEDVLESVMKSPESFARWGVSQGQGELAGAAAGQFIVPRALADLIGSGGDPAKAAGEAARKVRSLKEEIGS